MAYLSRIPIEVVATSEMAGDYKAFYSFDPTKALYGKDTWPATVIDEQHGQASGNQWQSQFMPIQAQWPLKLNADLGPDYLQYNIVRVYYENSHDKGWATYAGFKDISIYGTNSRSAYLEVRGDILTDLTLLWEGSFIQHAQTVQDQIVPYVSGNIADPQYITLTTTGLYRYYIFVIHNIFDFPCTSSMAYAGIRRIELQEIISSSSSSSSTEINSSSSSSSTEINTSSSSSIT